MRECESVDGEWGGVCPACGETLPARPGPLKSWKSSKELNWSLSYHSTRGRAIIEETGRSFNGPLHEPQKRRHRKKVA